MVAVMSLPSGPALCLLVERAEPALLLQRSLFVRMLDAAERVLPVLTPPDVMDAQPLMHPTKDGWQ